jgi:hypothetical protein
MARHPQAALTSILREAGLRPQAASRITWLLDRSDQDIPHSDDIAGCLLRWRDSTADQVYRELTALHANHEEVPGQISLFP